MESVLCTVWHQGESLVWNLSPRESMASAHRAAYLLFVGRTRRITQDTVKNGMHHGAAVYIIKAKALYGIRSTSGIPQERRNLLRKARN